MTADTRRFLNAAGEFLRADPARNTVILTVTEDLRVKAAASARALFGWWQPDGEPVGAAFMHTPDYPLLLSRVSVPAAARLAGDLTEARRRVPGVNAGQEAADAFAAAWRDRTGDAVAVYRRMRLFRLGELIPPGRWPDGMARLAARTDRDLLARWFGAFAREVGDPPGQDHRSAVAERLGYGGITVWEAGGVPVSVAGRTRAVAGMVRVGPVYTPPEAARARLRERRDRGRQPGCAGGRPARGGALHRPGQPHEQRLVPASGLPPGGGPRGVLLRAGAARVRLHP